MPECQKIKKDVLDQYGAERFGRLIFATIGKSVGLKGLTAVAIQHICYATVVYDNTRRRYYIGDYTVARKLTAVSSDTTGF